MSEEFSWCHPESRQNSSVYMETVLVPQLIKHCQLNSLCVEIHTGIDTAESRPDELVLTAIKCLLALIPTMGKFRVSSSAALRYIFEDVTHSATSLEQAISLQQEESSKLLRTQPFILKFGQSLFILVDGSAIVVKPDSLALAVDILLKSFYVFNIQYPKQTSVVHNFLAHTVLDLKGNLTPKALKLQNQLFRQEQ